MSYPFEIMFPDKDAPCAIRLKVAALCICLDHGSIDETPIPESETNPYFNPEDTVLNGESWKVWVRSHAFVNIEPTGNLARQTNILTAALADSIVRGQLKPLRLRVNISGEIDPCSTWLRGEDLADWCECRQLNEGDCLEQYFSDELAIHEAAVDAADSERARLETVDFDEKVKQRIHELDDENSALKLLKENIALRESGRVPHSPEKPLSPRERTTYLNIIGALMELIKSPRPGRKDDASVIRELIENYGEKPGISQSNLNRKIPEAKRSLEAN